MRIADIKILNFRKLEEVSVDLRGDTTVFIGANNSGKTSAMASMRYFLNPVGYKNFNIYDFTISNHAKIKEIGKRLENEEQKAYGYGMSQKMSQLSTAHIRKRVLMLKN